MLLFFTRFKSISDGISFHSSLHIVSSLWIVFGYLALTRTFSYRHKFSMGLRLGDCDGHSRTLIATLFNHLVTTLASCIGSLSCWNHHLRPSPSSSAFFLVSLDNLNVILFFFKIPSIRKAYLHLTQKNNYIILSIITMLHCRTEVSGSRPLCYSPYILHIILAEQLYLHFIWPQNLSTKCIIFIHMFTGKLQSNF